MLELCDIDKELHDFIEKNKTGSERPGTLRLNEKLIFPFCYTTSIIVVKFK